MWGREAPRRHHAHRTRQPRRPRRKTGRRRMNEEADRYATRREGTRGPGSVGGRGADTADRPAPQAFSPVSARRRVKAPINAEIPGLAPRPGPGHDPPCPATIPAAVVINHPNPQITLIPHAYRTLTSPSRRTVAYVKIATAGSRPKGNTIVSLAQTSIVLTAPNPLHPASGDQYICLSCA